MTTPEALSAAVDGLGEWLDTREHNADCTGVAWAVVGSARVRYSKSKKNKDMPRFVHWMRCAGCGFEVDVEH